MLEQSNMQMWQCSASFIAMCGCRAARGTSSVEVVPLKVRLSALGANEPPVACQKHCPECFACAGVTVHHSTSGFEGCWGESRAVHGMSFAEVVPLEALQSALGTDAPPVAGRLQRLLLPSFLPGPEAGPACLAQLLRGSPRAGRAFCAFLAGGAGVCP